MIKKIFRKSLYYKVLIFLLGIVFFLILNYGYEATSTNEFCESCHVHPHVTQSWKIGPHVYNKSGVMVNCVDCHLPPSGFEKFSAKITTGLRDFYGYVFKDSADFNWEQKSRREYAMDHVYKSGCLSCHKNLFPPELSKKGEDAHIYYDQKPEELRCINCHLTTGHYHQKTLDEIEEDISNKEIYSSAAKVISFENYKETIPGSVVDFEMVAIPGGQFTMGSPEDESFRNTDEGPQIEISISKFWMAKTEVTWDEYFVYLKETGKEGRTDDQIKSTQATIDDVDAISGPTPFYGNPDQGWGRGKRPAITMTHY